MVALQRQRCRRLLKKHPTAPKRNKTAYILFTEEKRPEIKATLPDGAHVRRNIPVSVLRPLNPLALTIDIICEM